MSSHKYGGMVGVKQQSRVGEAPEIYIKTCRAGSAFRSYAYQKTAEDFTYFGSSRNRQLEEIKARETQERLAGLLDSFEHFQRSLRPEFRLMMAVAAIPENLAIR